MAKQTGSRVMDKAGVMSKRAKLMLTENEAGPCAEDAQTEREHRQRSVAVHRLPRGKHNHKTQD